MENETNSSIIKEKKINPNPDTSISTSGFIQDYYFNHFLIIDQLPFDFEYEHAELFGFID
jgi:hypothetical protein